ncbi:MFS transporter [Candidatus Cytomitobacter indipagum]|uniref:MFS transporter n=1 Tax=Candidatus Cytomitobacter indipagum TaxID=2601575 RepID=A0A5C0UDM8_9PROT|nr:MFS transporter [Candidatus Cytomitobacter indipagum]QEK37859.1 MFS transporter [Candidatus Cytomitobacter indipagum]
MNLKKTFSAFWTLSGSMLEYYDYMLFTYMMPSFGPILLPFEDKSKSLLFGYALLFAASILRPVGAWFMGYVGDVVGRKQGLMISILCISIASLGMGLVPSYQTIGIFSVYIVFMLRILQAMSAGGDLNGSAIFLIEHLGKRPGFASGIAWASTVLGMILASFANYIAVQYEPNGWRYAFIIGASIGFVGMIMRTHIVEGEGFKKKPKIDCSPKSIYPYLSVIGMGAGIGGMYYYTMVFCFNYIRHLHDWNINLALWQTFCFAIYAASIVLSGWLSDYFNLNKIMKFFAFAIIAFAFPCFMFMKCNYMLFSIIMVILLGMFVGPSHNLTFSLFPPRYRYRSISVCYGIGTSIIGGATLYVCTKFISTSFPAIWLISCALMGYLGIIFAEKSPKIEYID